MKNTTGHIAIGGTEECEEHTKFELGYMESSAMAQRLFNKGYKQRQCTGCGLWKIWYRDGKILDDIKNA